MGSNVYRRLVPYSVAIAATGIAFLLTFWLQTHLGRIIGAFFYVAVMLSTWYGGIRPGSVTVILSALIIKYFFTPPDDELVITEDFLRLGLFMLTAFVISLLSNDLKRSQRKVQQLSQQLLEESRERLRMALAAAQMGMWDWDIVTGKIVWSPEHEQLFGLAPGTFDGRYETFDACLHPDDRDGLAQAVESALQSQSIYQHEFRVVWGDGSVHWIEGRGQTLYNEAGQAVRMSGTIMSIDHRKQAEVALMRSEQKLRAILDAEPECVKVITADGILQSINPAGLAIVETDTVEQALGQCIFPLIDPAYRQQFLEFTQAVASGKAGILEFEGTGLKGTRRWLESHAVPLTLPETDNTYVLAVTRDITERKRLEVERKRSEAERERADHVSRELRLLEAILDIILAGYWDWDLVNHQEYLSPGFKRMFGYEDHELSNSPETWQQLIFAEDLPGVFDCFNRHVQTHGGEPYYNEVRYRHKNGSTVWVICLGQVIEWDAAGTPLRMIGCHINISDRKQAEAALRESEERFRSAFDYAAIGIALVSTDGCWLKVNQALCDLVGYSNQELLATDFQTITHPDDLTTDLSYVHQLLNDEILTYQMEKRYFHKQGHIVWVLLSVSLVRDEQHQPLYFISQIQDINQRKRAEVALQESELKFHAVFDQSSQVIALVHPDGTLFDTNQGSRELTTRTGESIVGRLIWELDGWGRENQNHTKAAFDRALAGEVVGFEINLYHPDGSLLLAPDGSLITHDILIRAIRNEAGHVMFLTVSGWDISPLKQAEAALRESDRRWRSLLDNVELVVIGLDINGNVEYANPFFLRLGEYDLEEVLGQDWFARFIPKQNQSVKPYFQDLLEQHFRPHYQNAILTKTGEERLIAWNNTILRDASGHPVGTISIGEDITDRSRLEQMKAEFVSVVSHELRTPLTSMQAALSLLVEKIIDPTSEEGETIIQIAAEGVDRLVRLVNDILNLERLESGRMSLEQRLCNTANLIATAVDQMQAMADQAGITLVVTPGTFELNADPDRLLQVLVNLLSNALKFSDSGSKIWLTVESFTPSPDPLISRSPHLPISPSPHLPISPSPSSPTPYCLFTIQDEGRGIPADKLESIFERFQQVDASDSREKGGTGLGLAICRNIIQQHGGHIWAESTLEQGSTFYFTLPIAEKTSNVNQTSSDY